MVENGGFSRVKSLVFQQHQHFFVSDKRCYGRS